jgi:hypothetical protein
MGKVMANVGILDITTASEESIEGIDRVENLGVLLYSTETSKLVPRLKMNNLGTSIEAPKNYKLIQGQIEMNKNYFTNIKERVSLIAMGQVIIKPDVLQQDFENAVEDIIVNGQIICPESLASTVQSRCSKLNGKMLTYSGSYAIRMGKTDINDAFLKSLDENVSLALLGKAVFAADVDIELFNKKVKSLDVLGKLTIKEEYLEVLGSRIRDTSQGKLEVISKGYKYIDSDLTLNPITIKRYKNAKLFLTGMIAIESTITGELLKGHIDKIIVKDFIACRSELKEDVYALCEDVSVNICDYSGKAVIIDGERKLTQSELKYTTPPVSYIVRGEFKISEDVLPETFMEKVEHIDNFGEITCDDEHYGLLQAKLRVSSGEIIENGNNEDSNIGYLKL